MGGLTTALALAKGRFKNIHVYEAASDLGFVGAGIQLAPNMARILDRLGVWDDAAKDATVLGEISIKGGSRSMSPFLCEILSDGPFHRRTNR